MMAQYASLPLPLWGRIKDRDRLGGRLGIPTARTLTAGGRLFDYRQAAVPMRHSTIALMALICLPLLT